MGKYDEALAKSLEKGCTDFNATQRLGNVAGEQIYGGNAVVRAQAVIARNRGRADVAERLEKSLCPTPAKTDKLPADKPAEQLSSMEQSLRELENLSKSMVPAETESPADELDRLRRENRLLKNVLQRKKAKATKA